MKKPARAIFVLTMAAVMMVGQVCASAAPAFNKAKQISVVSREDGSGTRGAFIELFGVEVKDANGNKKDKTTKEAVIANKTDVMMTNVANDPQAIGYISLGSLNSTVKAVKIDGVEATMANVKNGKYKISRPFNVATKSVITPLARDFIDYIMSKQGQAIIASGYIAVKDNASSYSGKSPSGKIVIAGSSSVTPIMEKLKEAYEKVNPNAKLEIQMSDSSMGLTAAINGTCDIAMASRDLKDTEKEKLVSKKIALDGIAVIVNNSNTAADISSEQVRKIFTGETTKWSDIVK